MVMEGEWECWGHRDDIREPGKLRYLLHVSTQTQEILTSKLIVGRKKNSENHTWTLSLPFHNCTKQSFHETHQEDCSRNRLKSPAACLYTVDSTLKILYAAAFYIRKKKIVHSSTDWLLEGRLNRQERLTTRMSKAFFSLRSPFLLWDLWSCAFSQRPL